MTVMNESVAPQKSNEPYWYVVHTYSGYENKVKITIEKTIKNRNLEDKILEVRVPVKEVVEVRNGKPKKVEKKLFPGYVLIKMIMDDETWYIVRNTRGVTGFVGPGSKAVPLEDYNVEEEIFNEGTDEDEGERITSVDFEVGDTVSVIGGTLQGTESVVQAINYAHQTVTINVIMFDRETPIEVNITDVKKV